MFRVITLNVNGLRASAAKGLLDWLPRQSAEVVCLQEIRVDAAGLTPRLRAPGRLRGWFFHAERRGYGGVAIYTRREPDAVRTGIGWEEADREGRYLEVQLDGICVASLYLPSGSSGPHRQDAKYRFMERFLPWLRRSARDGRERLICGDWNIAHTPKDLRNWRANQDHSGFLPQERAWLDRVFGEAGWVDVYRRLHPRAEGEGYTWWSNRGRAWEKNVGWRIDYHVATPGIAASARAARVYKRRRFSDHAPLIVDYELG